MIPLTDEEHRINRTPYFTYLLIAANILFFFMSNDITAEIFGVRAGDILSGQNLTTLITSMFLHGGLLHLLFNMWSLWIFGDNVEDDLGPVGYLALYFVSGIVGSYAFALFADPESIAIGASGAISGIMASYLILHPRNRVLTLIPIGFFITTMRINAPIFIGIWFLLQFVGFSTATDSGIAYSAHVGGFLAGLVLTMILKKPVTREFQAN
ncbi:MAG TPA: rhomboid family intramembrane serine protease [Candidatus Binatia bacterium]|nr:rhomboid family intramembrane serine protease [Candidatus Binatia bacterium]